MIPIVLLGSGGHCRAVADVVLMSGRAIEGVVSREKDPGSPLAYLGTDDWLDDPRAAEFEFLVAVGHVGSSTLREQLHELLMARGLKLASVVSPAATVSASAAVGAGTVIMHRSVIGAHARVGGNCIVNTGAIVDHDAVVQDHAHVSTGAIVNGGARIGRGALIGSGAVVVQNIHVGAGAIVGAGSVVIRNLEEPGVYVGAPARKVK